MNLNFYKYEGCGNDFVMIDNRNGNFPTDNTAIIAHLCNRNFGIGGDGIILIENDDNLDFKMLYFNADGSQTFCGNGGRCAVSFANYLGIIKNRTHFNAIDGAHFAEIKNEMVSLKMTDASAIEVNEQSVFLYTGTQHHVELVEDLNEYPVYKNGKKIRDSYKEPGTNVNFVQKINNNTFRVRTYEKGVENETLACGTGVTAVAIAMHKTKNTASNLVILPVEGGLLEVSFTEKSGKYENIFLKGPATYVFKGTIEI
jgi:diaminopimelate epimerase